MFSLLIVLVNSGNDVWLKTNMAHDWTLEDDVALVTARARFQQLPGIYRRIREHPDYIDRFGQLTESALRSRYSKLSLAGRVPQILEQVLEQEHLGEGNGEGQQEGHLGHGQGEGHFGNEQGDQGGFDLEYDFAEDPVVLVNNEGEDVDEGIHFEEGLDVVKGLPDAGELDDVNWVDVYNVVNEDVAVDQNNEGGGAEADNQNNEGGGVEVNNQNIGVDVEAVDGNNNDGIVVGNENNAIAGEDGSVEGNNPVASENNTVAEAAVGPVGTISGPGAADEDST